MKRGTVQQHAMLGGEWSMQLLSRVVVCSYYLEFWLKVMINKTGEKRREFSLRELVNTENIATEAGSRREFFQPSSEIL